MYVSNWLSAVAIHPVGGNMRLLFTLAERSPRCLFLLTSVDLEHDDLCWNASHLIIVVLRIMN